MKTKNNPLFPLAILCGILFIFSCNSQKAVIQSTVVFEQFVYHPRSS